MTTIAYMNLKGQWRSDRTNHLLKYDVISWEYKDHYIVKVQSRFIQGLVERSDYVIILLLIVFVIWYFAKYYNLSNECEEKDCEHCMFEKCEKEGGKNDD